MAYAPDELDSVGERNQVNERLRASELWRNAIRAMGLNPDGPLHLTKTQQQSLAMTLQLPTSDFHIDAAGNINDYHGWKGLPTAAKIAIIGGAAVATAGAAGAFGGGAAATGEGLGLGGPFGYGAITPAMAAAAPTSAASAATAAGLLGGAAKAGLAGGAAKGAGGKIVDWLKSPQNLLGLAGAVPLAMQAFGGGPGGGSGSSPNEDAMLQEIRTNLGLQRARYQAAQPAFDTAQRMAVGMAPKQYRAGGV